MVYLISIEVTPCLATSSLNKGGPCKLEGHLSGWTTEWVMLPINGQPIKQKMRNAIDFLFDGNCWILSLLE